MDARIERENFAKRKAMQTYMFGRYALKVPILKQDRFIDLPLAESFAQPYKETDFSLAELAFQEAGYTKKRFPGQTLVGDMIPTIKKEDFTLAPTGTPVLHKEKLAKDAPGANSWEGTGVSQLVFAVSGAIILSWVGTPLLASFFSSSDVSTSTLWTGTVEL